MPLWLRNIILYPFLDLSSVTIIITLKLLSQICVLIAQCPPLSVQNLLQGSIWCQLTNVYFEIQRYVLPAVIKGYDGASNLVQTHSWILRLPVCEDAIQVTVMEVKQWICSSD